MYSGKYVNIYFNMKITCLPRTIKERYITRNGQRCFGHGFFVRRTGKSIGAFQRK